MIAASQGRNEIVRLLLKGKADPSWRDYTGRTALMWAEWNRKTNIAKRWCERMTQLVDPS